MDLGLLLGIILFGLAIFHGYQMHKSRGSLAPWIPSSKQTLREALKKIGARPGQRFIDLGSGSGTLVITAARRYDLLATGVEQATIPFVLSKLKSLFTKNTTFKYGDLYTEDLSSYDIIYVFGLPETVNSKLIEKLNNEVKPGTVVLSNYFPIHSREANDTIVDKWRRLYIYKW